MMYFILFLSIQVVINRPKNLVVPRETRLILCDSPQTSPWLLEEVQFDHEYKSEIIETVINVLLLIASMAMCSQVPIEIVTIPNMVVVYDFGYS